MEFIIVTRGNGRNINLITLWIIVALIIGNFGVLFHDHFFLNNRNVSEVSLANFKLIKEFEGVYGEVTPLSDDAQKQKIKNLKELFALGQEVTVPDGKAWISRKLKKNLSDNKFTTTPDINPVLCETNYMTMRNEKLVRVGPEHSLLDFIDDKSQTKKCLENDKEKIVFTPTICEIFVDIKTSDDFDNLWEKKIFPRLTTCFTSYFEEYPRKMLWMKPNHLSYAKGGFCIFKNEIEEVTWPWWLKEKVREDYCLDEKCYVEQRKNAASWMHAIPGILVQPRVSQGDYELRFYTIFGRAELLQFGGKCQGGQIYRLNMGRDESLFAQFYRDESDEWKPSKIPKTYEEKKFQ